MEQQLRQTAYKVWISDLQNKQVQKEEGEWSPNYILIDNKKVSRTNIIATVIMKYIAEDNSYATLTIDDGSSDIQIKAWKEDVLLFDNVEIGDPILFIGKIRAYNNQIYLTPEIIKVLDKIEWIELRKKELTRLYGKRDSQEYEINKPKVNIVSKPEINGKIKIEEESILSSNEGNSNRQKILTVIERLESEEGADILEVIENSNLTEDKANDVIQELLKEGEIFEIRSGRLKIIE